MMLDPVMSSMKGITLNQVTQLNKSGIAYSKIYLHLPLRDIRETLKVQ
jgi:hypothetical protein